jgi:hypothetical protein
MFLSCFALTTVSDRRSDTFVVRYVSEFSFDINHANHISLLK